MGHQLRSTMAVAASLLVGLVACESGGTEPEVDYGEGPDLQSNALEYQVDTNSWGTSWSVRIPYSYENRTGRRISGLCGGPHVTLQRFNGTEWVSVMNGAVGFGCRFAPAFHMGDQLEDTIYANWPVPPNSGGYEFRMSDPSGEFRVYWYLLNYTDWLGRLLEEVPLEHRVSNTFYLDFQAREASSSGS